MLFEQWLAIESQPLLLEGGAAGHMNHPFDDKGLTFGDLKKMVEAGLSGNLNFEEDITEKTDGQNVFATIQDGTVKFARNKTELKNPMTLSQFKDKFESHPSEAVKETFQFAAEDLAKQLTKLPKNKQQEYFNNGKDFMNMELIYSQNPNVIRYDTDVIQFHGIKKTDGNGNIIGEGSKKAAYEAAKILKSVEADMGKVFKIIPPKIIQLRKDIDFSKNKDKFLKRINILRNQYNLGDTDTISKYNEMWWKDQIEKSFPGLDQNVKDGLLLRWSYNDKKTMNMRDLSKIVSPSELSAIKKFDKEDLKLKYKENVEPLADIFLEVGSIVLKNASQFLATSPDKEAIRLRTEIQQAASSIKKTGSPNQIEKVAKELERLDRIGGINSVLPTEGIVFSYDGKIYKLTGAFAAINQLLGIIRYGS
tara:strand:- start:933 stop:2195 length:1263 start_codon:yes stop_codon:yes gene_type:complete